MVLYLLAKVYNGHNSYVLVYFRNGLIDSFEVFHLHTGLLTICAQAHHWRVASGPNKTVLGVDNAKLGILCYYRASKASEIL